MSHPPQVVDFDQLTPAEKILWIQDQWDRIADRPEDVAVTDVQREELDRRLQSYEANSEQGETWEKVRADIRRKLNMVTLTRMGRVSEPRRGSSASSRKEVPSVEYGASFAHSRPPLASAVADASLHSGGASE